jgi:hypothetical protein
MKFEVGKFYKHASGKTLYIIAEVKTFLWGNTLIAEEGSYKRGLNGKLTAVGSKQYSAVNYCEITEKEFLMGSTK